MKTYSKRHRLHENNVVVDVQTNRKRVYHLETEGRPMKRKKFVDQPGMFETPHPTLEANSQVYKLPSTKPIPSPTPFSPVPITAPTQSLDLRTRSHFVPTTSGSLKENAGSSKSMRRKSSKTLSSFTLTSRSGPASRNIALENGKQTRSPSRSSNSASSRSRSSDHTRLSKLKAKLTRNPKFKPNATMNDLNERRSSKSRSKPFTKRRKSILLASNAEQTLLASPFASRAPSPTGIAKSGLNESMGPPVPAESKLAAHTRGVSNSKKGRLSQVFDAFSSPEKQGTRKRSSARLFDRGPGITNENDSPWKNRRPSAPSNLQRPSRPVGKAHTPTKRATKMGHKQFKDEIEVTFLESEQRKRNLSGSIDPIKDWDKQLSVETNDNPDPFFWMEERSAVDFNRPPSQLSLHVSSGFIHAEDAEAEGVFWSSGEENDGNNNKLRLGVNLEATNATSTPYKTILARRLSVPIVDGPGITGSKTLGSMGASDNKDVSSAIGDNNKSEEDMELTAPLGGGGNPESCQKDSMSFQDHTPWTTDSIISPPTAYLERKKPVDVEKGIGKKVEHLVSAEQALKMSSPFSSVVRTQTGVLSSPFGYSYAESTSSVVESVSMNLQELVVGDQVLKEGDTVTTDKDIATVQPQGPLQRTRSGTILAARNGSSIARRTRSGTIVGPSTIGRTRSGTIVAKAKIPEQNLAAGGNRGTRGVVGLVPDSSGQKGLRSSTDSVAELEPKNIPNAAGAEVEARATVDGELTKIKNTCNESCIEEVNEAECYVDSLYLTSSPDPIDFLTGAKIDGDESTLVIPVGDWQVADGPPSPEIWRTKKTIQTPRGMGTRSTTWRFKPKRRARFLDADGQVDGYGLGPKGSNLNVEDGPDDTSDDELLLVEGQSQSLFG